MIMYPREMAQDLCRFYRDFIDAAPDEVGGALAFLCVPPIPEAPPEMHGKPVVGVIAAYFGAVKDGEEALRPLLEFGPPAMAHVEPIPYTALQMMLNDAFPDGARVYF